MSSFYNIISEEYGNQLKRTDTLVQMGMLAPITSYSQYDARIRKIKAELGDNYFSNCALLKNEVERLIRLFGLYEVVNTNGFVFVVDKHSHWQAYICINPNEKFIFPKLDKSVLIEMIGRKENDIQGFESIILSGGFKYYETYRQIDGIPKLSKEEFERLYNVVLKSLKMEGALICVPKEEQLIEFDEIYIQEMDIFSQQLFTLDERKRQMDEGLLKCVVGRNGEILAINVASQLFGGVIAAKRSCVSNIYAPALLLHGLINFYSREKVIKPKDRVGWIADSNASSNKLYNLLKIGKTDKFFRQYVKSGFLY
ncbi:MULTISPECIES: hypothetical protein [unclassified Acutalibacter]|jgi:hypothetical protein|uniref:hypothetical protein n=1 Tax=unclassified Acutalibacter TaxID=2620728 RepID=UPI001412DBE2|nr:MULTISPECIES: hypothetical protein [unclassified Acutalibacter]MCI9226229.1 hypothetical protein [Acutalibacter sp.]NBJ90824.1 hypothetical protein [Acutalibacter sp. 1XD8-36]